MSSSDSENYNDYYLQSFLGYVLHNWKKDGVDIESFMPTDTIKTFVQKLWNDFREDELFQLNIKGNNSQKKMIIYKFFFVSYLVSLLTRILYQKCDQLDIDFRLEIKQLWYNFIEICQGINMKNRMSKLLQNIEEVNDKDDKHQAKV